MVFGMFGKSDEKIQELIDNKQFDELPTDVIDELAQELIVTTETTLSGYEVTEHIDVITAECVFGMNIFRDMFAGIRDILGGRSSASQKVPRDARHTCLTELRREALIVGRAAFTGFSGIVNA
ncbi:MAG: heavy metal-binding domain-containing protein [Magnetovibrio sp.]|nr:heavy metal-binding domain-containing protein [Magnetovibrio sp.]